MENIDNEKQMSSGLGSHDDEDLLMNDVVGDDHELLYLDTFLKDMFKED